MIEKKYRMVHLPLLAFFSRKLYCDIGHNWKGMNFAYLFLLLAICWIPSSIKLRHDLVQSLDSNQVHLINQIPDIHIRNGRVEVEQQNPLPLKNSAGQTVAIIDTTGSMNFIEDPNVAVLLTDSELIIRRDADTFNTLNLSQVTEFHLNREIAGKWLQTTRNALAPLSYGLFLLLSYIFAVLAMLLTAIIGLILSNAMHSALKFAATLRIAVAAATPSIILITVSSALGLSIPGPVYIAFTLTYLLIGIKACSKPREKDIPKLKLAGLLEDSEKDAAKSNAA